MNDASHPISNPQLERFSRGLRALESRNRLRCLTPAQGVDFASNDYLGLASSAALQDAACEALNRGTPVGAGASRLLRGNSDEHAALEREAAEFFGVERALYLAGGFTANVAIFSTLPAPGDLILHDALIHASTHDGMRLGRAETRAFAHNNLTDAREKLTQWRKHNDGLIWITCESVYSMDGDFAPVDALFQLAEEFGAILVVDEAHATGVYGDKGRGLSHPYAARSNVLSLHTCGKGLGSFGALVCGAAPLIDTLINRARGFIFSTAPAPLNAAIVRAALRQLNENNNLQAEALDRIAFAHEQAQRFCGLSGFQCQIMPVVIGPDKETMALATRLQNLGHDVRGIRPPTVPRGTARLRISITLNVSNDDITNLFRDLGQLMETRL